MPHPACQEAEGQALTLLGEWEVGVPTGSGRAGGAGVSLILTPPFFFLTLLRLATACHTCYAPRCCTSAKSFKHLLH